MAVTVNRGLLAAAFAIPVAALTAAFYWAKSRKIHEDIEDRSGDLMPELSKVNLEQLEVVVDEGVLTDKGSETCRNSIDELVCINKTIDVSLNNNSIVDSLDSDIPDVMTASQDSLCINSHTTQSIPSTQSNITTESSSSTTQSLTNEGSVNADAVSDDADAVDGEHCVSDSGQDSDRGEAWTEDTQLLIYQFHIPAKLCGRFIGTAGSFINKLKNNCDCKVTIDDIQNVEGELKLCSVEGTRYNIEKCLDMIGDKFDRSPELTLEQTNKPRRVDAGVNDGSITLSLAPGTMHRVFVSSIVSGGHIFLQQLDHPTFPALERLDQCMLNLYSDHEENTPKVPRPIQPTSVVVAPSHGGWYRCLVMAYNSVADTCDVKYLDYGGYETVQADQLRQIRLDFLSLPFQAIEVYLANIVPSGVENVAAAILEEMVSDQIVKARQVGHAEDGTALVHLYRRKDRATAMVNRELVDRGVATWVEVDTAQVASTPPDAISTPPNPIAPSH